MSLLSNFVCQNFWGNRRASLLVLLKVPAPIYNPTRRNQGGQVRVPYLGIRFAENLDSSQKRYNSSYIFRSPLRFLVDKKRSVNVLPIIIIIVSYTFSFTEFCVYAYSIGYRDHSSIGRSLCLLSQPFIKKSCFLLNLIRIR